MGNKKKILAIIGASYVFGAEKVSLDVLKGLKKNGHTIHCMVSGWNDGDFVERLKVANIDYSPIKLGWYYVSKILWSLDSLINYPKAIYDFVTLKMRFKPEILYTISFRQIVLLYPFIRSSSVIYNVQEPSSNSRISRFCIKLIDSKVKYFTTCSNFIKEDLISCGISNDKIHVIYNGVDILEIETSVSQDFFTIGIVGQIIPRKGHHIVLEALDYLKNRNVLINLKIVGRGDAAYENFLKEQVAEYKLDKQVFWIGFVKEMKNIYKGIDVIIAPTQNEEPFGLMTSEANMFAIPAIVSNKGGLPEIIEDGVTGFTFNANNPTELAEKIQLFYHDKDKVHKMGLEGRKRIINLFSVDQMNKKLNELILSFKN